MKTFLSIIFIVFLFSCWAPISKRLTVDNDGSYKKIKNLITLAKFHLKSKNFIKARNLYRKVLETWTHHIESEEARFMLAEIDYLQKDFNEAKRKYHLYLKEYPFGSYTQKAHTRLQALISKDNKNIN